MTDKEYTKQLAEAYNERHGIPKKKQGFSKMPDFIGKPKRIVSKERRILRADLLIIVVAFFAILAFNKLKPVTPPPKLVFSPVTQGYQLQRAIQKNNAVNFEIAGTIVFDDGSVAFNLNSEPLYPWESQATSEYADKMWLNYEKIMSTAEKDNKTAIGVLEYNSEYYFAVESGKENLFYPLSGTVRIEVLTDEQMQMILTAKE